jgi:hypothetical protein
MAVWRTHPSTRHFPIVDISNPRVFEAYCRGLEDGRNARLHEPGLNAQQDEKTAYSAGFAKARQTGKDS